MGKIYMKVSNNYTCFGNACLHAVFLGYEIPFHLYRSLGKVSLLVWGCCLYLRTFRRILRNVHIVTIYEYRRSVVIWLC
jgi:hypothetical protein